MHSGICLVIILLIVFCIDNYQNKLFNLRVIICSFIEEYKRFIWFLVIPILNVFILLSDFSDERFVGVFDVFLPNVIIDGKVNTLMVDLIKFIFLNMMTIINGFFIIFCFSSSIKHKSYYKFFSFLCKYKEIFFFILGIVVLSLVFSKLDLILEGDITKKTQVSYINFSTFNNIARVFLIIRYISFISLLCNIILIFVFFKCCFNLIDKKYSKKLQIKLQMKLVCVSAIISFNLCLFSEINSKFNSIDDSDIINILIDSSYVNSDNITRCKSLVEKMNEKNNREFKYLLFLDANHVSLVSRNIDKNEIEYKFAIGNCDKNTGNVVSEYSYLKVLYKYSYLKKE